jgi:hypothetical protein
MVARAVYKTSARIGVGLLVVVTPSALDQNDSMVLEAQGILVLKGHIHTRQTSEAYPVSVNG